MNIKKIENENSHNKIDKSSSFEKRATLLKGIFLGFSVVAVVIGLQIIYATTPWTGPPTGALPGTQNIAAPINVGTITQTKQGGLNIMGNVGIGDTTPDSKLDVEGGSIRISTAGEGLIFSDGTYITTRADAIPASCLGVPGATANCFLDVDGDDFSPATGDCDELCPTCFVGSTHTTPNPDGKDQNCDGIIDGHTKKTFYNPKVGTVSIPSGHAATWCSRCSGGYTKLISQENHHISTSYVRQWGSGCSETWRNPWGSATVVRRITCQNPLTYQ